MANRFEVVIKCGIGDNHTAMEYDVSIKERIVDYSLKVLNMPHRMFPGLASSATVLRATATSLYKHVMMRASEITAHIRAAASMAVISYLRPKTTRVRPVETAAYALTSYIAPQAAIVESVSAATIMMRIIAKLADHNSKTLAAMDAVSLDDLSFVEV